MSEEQTGFQPQFHVGQIVRHAMFGYRGVVFDVDPVFSGTEAWYDQVARSRPPKERPWYHVLVDGASHTTYVAERNLEPDPTPAPIDHPALDSVFAEYANGRYMPVGGYN